MTTAAVSPLDRWLDALDMRQLRPVRRGDHIDARCPAHDDRRASLSLDFDRAAGKVLLNCHRGCDTGDVVHAAGLTWADLYVDKPDRQPHQGKPAVVARYEYHDEQGRVLYRKLRFAPKDFRVDRPDGRGGWTWGIGRGTRRVLYRLPELQAAVAGDKPVLVVEGEKDADRAVSDLHVAATCNFDGAAKSGTAKWRPEYTEQLRGALVLIIADRDEAGLAHARAVAAALDGVAKAVRVMLPAVDFKGADLTDHLDAGFGIDDLVDLDSAEQVSGAAHVPTIPDRQIDPQYPQNSPPAGRSPRSEGIEGVSPAPWPSLMPLPGRTQPLPTDALGPILQPLVEDIADALQVPTDLPVNLALPLITTAAKGGWVIEVQAEWAEALCLPTLSALASGERKSPTLKVLDTPLRAFEQARQKEMRPEIAQQSARRKLVEGRVEELRKKALRPTATALDEGFYLDEVARLDALVVEHLPRWLADDATPEKFLSLLADHGAIGAISAEPGIFGILAGRYSSGTPNFDWFLRATSGETVLVDRIGREPERVEQPALSVACCIQPGRLVDLGKVKAFRESGLLARFLFAVPQSLVGTRDQTRAVRVDLLTKWGESLANLAAAGQKHRMAGPTKLRLTPAARSLVLDLNDRIEPHLDPGHGKYAGIADWMGKLAGATVRIAGALTLLGDPAAVEVDEQQMANAIRLGEAYVSHALAAFGMTRPNSEIHAQAKQVLSCLIHLATEQHPVSRRALHQKLRDRTWVESAESLDPPLRVLTEHGHIREAPQETGRPGRPSVRFEIHPNHR